MYIKGKDRQCKNCKNYLTPAQLNFCSTKCASFFSRGKGGIRAKNGAGTICGGYKLIMMDGVRIVEHRHIMEKHLGRKLLKSERVHHIDGDKLNNQIGNLQLVKDQGSHMQLHKQGFSNKTHKQCCLCKKIKLRDEFHEANNPYADKNAPECKLCNNERQRQYYWRKKNDKGN